LSEEKHKMEPMSGEKVEVDGTYVNESGREAELERGSEFPSDLVMGSTEWKLVEYQFDNHHEGRTDPRLVPKKDAIEEERGKITHPRRQLNGDNNHF
jgi:hypothetical protein